MAKTKSMQAGDLDRFIEITQKNQSLNLQGEVESTSYGPYLPRVPAAYKAVAGKEDETADRETAYGKAEFTIRYNANVKPVHRLVYENEEYDIENVREGEGRHQWTVIDAKKRN